MTKDIDNDKDCSSLYLGDGVWATIENGNAIITSNHHLVSKATDVVYLDSFTIQNLVMKLYDNGCLTKHTLSYIR